MKTVRLVGDVLLQDRRRAYEALLGAENVSTGDGRIRGVDLVDVALGAPGAAKIVGNALSAGAKAIVLGADTSEYDEIARLIQSNSDGVRLAHPIRFDQKYLIPHEESRDRKLGEVITVRVIRTGSPERHIAVEELNVLDALLLLGGPVSRVLSRRVRLKSESSNSCMSVLRFANRAIGYGEACTAYPAGYDLEVIEVVTQDAMIEYDSFTRVNRLVRPGSVALLDSYHVPPYQAMVRDYLDAFAGEAQSSVSRADSLALLELARAVAESATSPKAVTL